MTENPILKVIERIARMAQRHGVAYCRITWDADKEEFLFTPLLKEFVEVNYERSEITSPIRRLRTALERAAALSLGTLHDDAYTYKQKLDETHNFIKRVLEQEYD